MSEEKYQSVVRLIAIATAIILWTIGIIFSTDGFSFIVPKYSWMGGILAVVVTCLEIILNERGDKHTLSIFLAGIGSYAFDIYTNVAGILISQGNPNISANPLLVVFPILLGCALAIIPEPLLLYGLLGNSTRDILRHLLGANKTNGDTDMNFSTKGDRYRQMATDVKKHDDAS